MIIVVTTTLLVFIIFTNIAIVTLRDGKQVNKQFMLNIQISLITIIEINASKNI
jgi:hypothetical protein